MSETVVSAKKHPLTEDERVRLGIELALHARAEHAWSNARTRFERLCGAIRAAALKRLELVPETASKFVLREGEPVAIEVAEAPAQVAPENVAAPV